MKIGHVGVIQHRSEDQIAEHQNVAEIANAIKRSGRSVSIIKWESLSNISGTNWPVLLGPRPDLLIEITTWGRPIRGIPTLALVWRPIGTWTPDYLRYEFYATSSYLVYEHLRTNFRPDLPERPLELDHTLDALPNIDLEKRAPRIFYVGTNWDRTVFRGGRAHGLLKTLDSNGLVDIYGPSVSPSGLKVWDDFSGYRGPIKFEPGAVPSIASGYRAALALTTPSHAASQICTSRAFEGASAGCVVIAPDLPEFRRLLGEAAYYIDPYVLNADFRRDRRLLIANVRRIKELVTSNEWRSLAKASHARFVDRFQLSVQVDRLLQSLEEMMAQPSDLHLTASRNHGLPGVDPARELGDVPVRETTWLARSIQFAARARAAIWLRMPLAHQAAFRLFSRFHS